MSRLAILTLGFIALNGLTGCGSNEAKVSGTVYVNEQPAPGAMVSFHPADEATKGLGGEGRTDEKGHYTLTAKRGGGLAPGNYKVVISRPLKKDGTPGDPNVPPIESDAKESLPANYSSLDSTELHAQVSSEKTVHDFKLSVKGKR